VLGGGVGGCGGGGGWGVCGGGGGGGCLCGGVEVVFCSFLVFFFLGGGNTMGPATAAKKCYLTERDAPSLRPPGKKAPGLNGGKLGKKRATDFVLETRKCPAEQCRRRLAGGVQ